MRKRADQVKVGDQLMFVGQWRIVTGLENMGYGMGHIYFSNYPPVVTRAGDTFEYR
jgi:hypothetical protein